MDTMDGYQQRQRMLSEWTYWTRLYLKGLYMSLVMGLEEWTAECDLLRNAYTISIPTYPQVWITILSGDPK